MRHASAKARFVDCDVDAEAAIPALLQTLESYQTASRGQRLGRRPSLVQPFRYCYDYDLRKAALNRKFYRHHLDKAKGCVQCNKEA